ncbi:hypothetical protein AB0J74_22365 [Asanoa sp. NPDC049573]
MCTDAYREALTQAFLERTAPPPPAPAPERRPAASTRTGEKAAQPR